MEWLAVSLVASAVLTVLLNVGLRVFPSMRAHLTRTATQLISHTTNRDIPNERRVRVFAPWKAMIAASLILTLLINLIRLMS
jgi:hypothetical protein